MMCQTRCSHVLCSVNPLRPLGLYGPAAMSKIRETLLGSADSKAPPGDPPASTRARVSLCVPHPYVVAHRAFEGARQGLRQSVLISGESGAGKTEATKILLQYMSFASSCAAKHSRSDPPSTSASGHDIEHRIIQVAC